MACKRKSHLKIHMSVNARIRKILSMKVTYKQFHDGRALPELVGDITKPDRKTTVCKLLTDGACDDNNVFGCLSDNGILPCIKTRKNAGVNLKTKHIHKSVSFGEEPPVCKDGRTA